MKALRITYKVYFTNDEILCKTTPNITLSRDFTYSCKGGSVLDRFQFEKRVAEFRRSLAKLYKMVSVDKTIEYSRLDVNEI